MHSQFAVTRISEHPAFAAPFTVSKGGQAAGQLPGIVLQAHASEDPQRAVLENLIQALYMQSYTAVIRAWMPVLTSLRLGDQVVAAAGYRDAHEPLYLERYLDAPVQDLLAARSGFRPGRDQIVEVGHFSAFAGGAGRKLIPVLGNHLRQNGFRWAVSTVTGPLHALLVRSGYAPLLLGLADASRLEASDREDWGSYYSHKPVVVAVDLYSKKALERAHEH